VKHGEKSWFNSSFTMKNGETSWFNYQNHDEQREFKQEK
jgi:hypothetical protein